MSEAEIRAAYRDHKDAIYRFAWRMTGSTEAAEDILQECFLSLLRSSNGYVVDRGSLRAFLFGVARNLGRKRWRSEQRWVSVIEDDFVAEPLDPGAGQTADLVAKAVQSLPPLQREALVMFEYEELSLEEIARAAEVEVGTVKARLSRARENLRRMLAPYGEKNGRS
jgi:RNA polymerase sigma-70 factor, ECF subfamily